MEAPFEPTAIDAGARRRGGRLHSGCVPAGMRRLEPRVLLVMAGLLGALAALAPGQPGVFGGVLLALLSGFWATRRPARRQGQLLLRGTVFLAGWLLLARDAGPAILLAGLATAIASHAFLLRWWGAAVLLLLGLTGETAWRWWDAGPPDPWQALVDGLLLAVAAAAGTLAGHPLRRAEERREMDRVDTQTGLYNRPGLVELGDDLLARCRTRSEPVSLVVFECRDLLEVRGIYGAQLARLLLERLVARLGRVAGDAGLAARTGPVQFAVLLPGADRELALRQVQRALGLPARIEYEQEGHELVLVPEFLVEMAGGDTPGLAAWYAALSRRIARARDWDERRRRQLRRSRHGSRRSQDLQPTAAVPLAPTPATLQAPLTA